MSPQPEQPPYVRKVVLPSGRTIEVVYFDQETATAAVQPAPEAPADGQLHLCGTCGSSFVHPLDWEPVGDKHWQITLRCPECYWIGTGVFAQEAVERFDEELDKATDEISGDLRRLVAANMEDEIERFVVALSNDHILPADF